MIIRKGPRTKLLMEISLAFSNIVINCSKGEYFLSLLHTSLDQFYNLCYVTKVTPLPEPKRSHQNCHKQFVQKITSLLYGATCSNFTYKILFVYSQSNFSFKTAVVCTQVQVLLTHPIISLHFTKQVFGHL